MQALSSAVLVAVLAASCTGEQAHRVRRPAELSIGGALAGVLATSLAIAALPAHKPILIPVAIGFGGLAVISAIVFGVAYANEVIPPPPPPPPPPPDHRGEAWALTQRAQTAARANDCATVRSLDVQVGQLDAGFHAAVFVRDVAIAACLRDEMGTVPVSSPVLSPPP